MHANLHIKLCRTHVVQVWEMLFNCAKMLVWRYFCLSNVVSWKPVCDRQLLSIISCMTLQFLLLLSNLFFIFLKLCWIDSSACWMLVYNNFELVSIVIWMIVLKKQISDINDSVCPLNFWPHILGQNLFIYF